MKTNVVQMARPNRSPEEWATEICDCLQRSVQSILETGRKLTRAKRELGRGGWGRLFDEKLIPISIDTAQRLMRIAKNEVLSNTDNCRFLPTSWQTLYVLSNSDLPRLEEGIRNGLINPQMTREEALKIHHVVVGNKSGDDCANPGSQQNKIRIWNKALFHLCRTLTFTFGPKSLTKFIESLSDKQKAADAGMIDKIIENLQRISCELKNHQGRS